MHEALNDNAHEIDQSPIVVTYSEKSEKPKPENEDAFYTTS